MKRFLYIILLCTGVVFSQEKKFKIVLDAGHGGKDPGAMRHGLVEKEIALDVVLRLGKILEAYPEFDILYTRKTDIYPTLKERAKMANDFQADLFISVHCNATPNGVASGAMTLVMGLSRSNMNLDIAKTENSVILQEADYKENYQNFDPNNPTTTIGLKLQQEENLMYSIAFAGILQDGFKNLLGRKDLDLHQQPLWVLDATTMPGVLIELGFLSNYKESLYMRTEEAKSNYAQMIAKSVIEYKNKVTETNTPIFALDIKEPVIIETTETETKPADIISEQTKYRVQLCFLTNKLEPIAANFMGLTEVNYKEENNGFKYFYGELYTQEEAKKILTLVQEKGYKTAFISEVVVLPTGN